MKRVGKVGALPKPRNGTADSSHVFNLCIRRRYQTLDGGSDSTWRMPIKTSQHPLEFEDHGLWNKDRLGSYCLSCRGRLLGVVTHEQADEDVSIDRAHAAA